MAEFKLGRIRFVWKNDWVTGTPYYKDDVVRFGGKVYICQSGHTSATDFNTDLDINPTKWNLLSDGQRWTGDWTTNHPYEEGDIAKYGGTLYLCTNGHTSAATTDLGLEDNSEDWDIFVEGIEWKGAWLTSTRYKFYDVVRYGGINYICVTHHTSRSTADLGLEYNSNDWQVFTQGQEWKGDWAATTRYKLNDIVKYGAGLWICTAPHSSTTFTDDVDNWAKFTEGFKFEETWSSIAEYKPGDIVRYGGNDYIAIELNTNSNPFDVDPEAPDWKLFSEGLKYQFDWVNTTSYKIGEVVKLNGHNYVAIADSPSYSRTVTVSNGSTDRFTTSSTLGLSAGMTVRFTGTTFGGVLAGARYYIRDIVDGGSFTITDISGGALFNLTGGSGSMTATISAEPPNTTFWASASNGFYWKGAWVDDFEYNVGDVVRYNSNSYICILPHRSEGDDGSTISLQGGGSNNSRPDLDATGTYWNILTVGSETSVLTTVGDMVYYGGAGPTRLPVGTEGQVLRVGAAGVPEWVTWGKVDHVYYVAPTGENRPYPDCGASLDKPWSSIRYACQQIEKGARNPQARHLLELNRVFIQREVTSWIDYQIANAGGTGIWNGFDYDEYKCERDVGFVVDRIVWDITHGGNLKTLAAALTYINALSSADLFATAEEHNGTGTYTKLSTEGDNDAAAFNYMKTVINAVLANEAPETVYQNVTDDSTSIVTQYINADYTAEDGVVAEVSTLVDIVTTALTDQAATNLPSRLVPSNTINIKTGNYSETLPIIVPAETALVGDEVRSVHAAPRAGTTPREDSFYTVSSMNRLATIVNDVVSGATVTASEGNVESQSSEWPFSTQTVADLATSKLRAMKYNIDFRLGTINSFSYPDPVDYNTYYLVGYGDARTLILGNKEFFKAQVDAWLTTNYPDIYYSRTACKRDVGYIVDALVYDLTYGGNVMSCQAGLAYYQGVGSSLFIDSTETAATLAAYAYLKTMLQAAAAKTTIASLQTDETQYIPIGYTGGSAAATFIGNNIDEMIDIVTNGPTAETRTNPSTTWVASALTTASSSLSSAKTTIQSNTISWINSNYPDLDYNETKCSRDVGYMIDAVRYDFVFNSNFQTLKAAYAYLRATAVEVYSLGQKAATRAAWEYVRTQAIDNVGSNATAIARINILFQAIDDIIYSGSNEGDVCATESRDVDYAILQLERNRDFIVQELDAWMNYNYVNFDDYYSSTTCARDIGYIVDAVISDLATGSNFASSVAGESYYRIQAALVPGAQLMQTVAAVNEAKRLAAVYVTDSSQYTAVNAAFDNVIAILEGGLTVVPTYTWPDNGTSSGTDVSDAAALQTNRATMVTGIETYLSTTSPYDTVWSGLTLSQKNACKRDVGYIIDAVTYDLQYGGTMQSTIAGSAYYSFGTLEIAAGEKAATLAALTQLGTLMKAYTSAGGDTKVDAKIAVVYGIVNTGATEPMTYTLPVVTAEGANTQATYAAILDDKATIQTGVTTYITDTFSSYTYNTALCNRDTNEIIDALKWDLQYSSNYKTLLCSRWYANAVIGSKEEDMFYLRNGTGVRNMTLEGLNGDLTTENAYGTRRVTAGAYASLDPGWGPADFRTWIVARSPYVQNVCTFGNAAIGQKIDGALHNGGNKSIVSNDFTQIISDGIGAWVTNDARAELVSVFTYYSHIGYLAENGGRIRGTNGNNSYGDFGSVAEGYDVTETPIHCEVDNTAFSVAVGSVLTDGIDYLWQLEYDNAGTDYTQATWSLTGGGSNAKIEQADFRDGAVYQVRLLDNVDDSALAAETSGNYGGYGYVSNANTAQSGTLTSLTLGAVDDEISSAYVGMKVLISGGTGAGQYGIIDTYSATTKIATVVKESTGGSGWDHVVSGTTIVSPDASSTYIVEPAISFTSPTYSSTARSLATAQSYTESTYAPTFGVYTPIAATGGTGTSAATFTVVRKGIKYSAVNIVSAGLGYTRLDTLTLAGTSLGGASTTNDITITVTAVNSSTGEIQAFEFDGVGAGGKFIATSSGSRTTNTSVNGTAWTENLLSLPSTSTWNSVASGALTVVEAAGSFVTGRAYVITSLGNTVFTSIGATANIVGTYFVATGAGGAGTTGTATPVANHLVAVSGSTTVNAYSTDGGTSWTAGGALPAAMSGASVDVAYGLDNGTGKWVAIASNGKTAYSTNGGVSWTAGGDLPAGTWAAVTYGAGRWIAIATGGTQSAYSTNGSTAWSAGGSLGTSSTWIDITYGANKFVAVSSDGAVSPVYTVNGGTNWYNTGVAGWLNQTVTTVSYGQGVFVATNSTSNNMVSSEDGINWTTRAITRASGTGALRAVPGNPSQTFIWAIIPSASTTAASSAIIGATAKARAYVSDSKIFAIRITDPGSAYASAPTLTITDPSNLYEAPTQVRIGNGACANVSFINRGVGYDSAIIEIDTGDGYADNFQNGAFMAVRRLTGVPEAGANVVFSSQPNTVYKLVQVLSQSGTYDGGIRSFLQISPTMSLYNSPADGTSISTRIRYSQVRLTGHDFLDIGTGGFSTTNYPNEPTQTANQFNETVDNNGGRVFYTSTDQDGNFRVGELFVIEQATGKATLNADAFNIAGLSELSLGNITLGGNSATVTEFSTDPFLTANSDNVVPTQRAIKAYISAQIGGGGASLNVNSMVAGFIEVAGTRISTTTGGTIQMKANFNFQAGVRGLPVAWNYFLNN